VEREVLVGTAQTGDEVICTFEWLVRQHCGGGCAAERAGSDVGTSHEVMEGSGCFFVELWELCFESALGQENMGSFIDGDNFRA
jgi:hypothetical protein